jgi:hypothetical protein
MGLIEDGSTTPEEFSHHVIETYGLGSEATRRITGEGHKEIADRRYGVWLSDLRKNTYPDLMNWFYGNFLFKVGFQLDACLAGLATQDQLKILDVGTGNGILALNLVRYIAHQTDFASKQIELLLTDLKPSDELENSLACVRNGQLPENIVIADPLFSDAAELSKLSLGKFNFITSFSLAHWLNPGQLNNAISCFKDLTEPDASILFEFGTQFNAASIGYKDNLKLLQIQNHGPSPCQVVDHSRYGRMYFYDPDYLQAAFKTSFPNHLISKLPYVGDYPNGHLDSTGKSRYKDYAFEENMVILVTPK